MTYCNECGKKNDDDAQYCTKCGNYLTKRSKWEKNIEEAAEEFGRKAERFGKRVEKKAKDRPKKGRWPSFIFERSNRKIHFTNRNTSQTHRNESKYSNASALLTLRSRISLSLLFGIFWTFFDGKYRCDTELIML